MTGLPGSTSPPSVSGTRILTMMATKSASFLCPCDGRSTCQARSGSTDDGFVHCAPDDRVGIRSVGGACNSLLGTPAARISAIAMRQFQKATHGPSWHSTRAVGAVNRWIGLPGHQSESRGPRFGIAPAAPSSIDQILWSRAMDSLANDFGIRSCLGGATVDPDCQNAEPCEQPRIRLWHARPEPSRTARPSRATRGFLASAGMLPCVRTVAHIARRGTCGSEFSQRSMAYPTSPDSKEPDSTPSRTMAWCSGSSNASVPMNRLIVKPMPASAAAP